jgi:hypothetical protein
MILTRVLGGLRQLLRSYAHSGNGIRGSEPLTRAIQGSAPASQVAACVSAEQGDLQRRPRRQGRPADDWAQVELAALAAPGMARWLLVGRRRYGDMAFYAQARRLPVAGDDASEVGGEQYRRRLCNSLRSHGNAGGPDALHWPPKRRSDSGNTSGFRSTQHACVRAQDPVSLPLSQFQGAPRHPARPRGDPGRCQRQPPGGVVKRAPEPPRPGRIRHEARSVRAVDPVHPGSAGTRLVHGDVLSHRRRSHARVDRCHGASHRCDLCKEVFCQR